jgi:hypothetical protein
MRAASIDEWAAGTDADRRPASRSGPARPKVPAGVRLPSDALLAKLDHTITIDEWREAS